MGAFKQERRHPINTNYQNSNDDATLVKLLTRKRARLSARLSTLSTQASEIETTIASIDATLEQIKPRVHPVAFAEAERAARAAPLFAKGECLALIKQILGESYQPLVRIELVRAVMARKGLPLSDELKVRAAVGNILRSGAAATTGIVATDPTAQYPRWTLQR